MIITVHPSILEGEVKVPSSKSIAQRAIIAGILAEDEVIINNISKSDDVLSLMRCGASLGKEIENKGHAIRMKGKMKAPSIPLHIGESGLGARLIIPLASLLSETVEVTGEGSILNRPMSPIYQPLTSSGVHIESQGAGNFLPWKITGPIQGGKYHLDGSISSQFLSGLLMSLPTCKEDSTILVQDLKSIPYVDLTLEILAHFGINISHNEYQNFEILGNQKFSGGKIRVDGDWSSAASLLVAGAVAGGSYFKLKDLGGNFTQADKVITGALLFSGSLIERNDKDYELRRNKIRGFQLDATDSPDLFPVLAALAVFAKKPSRISGLHRLTHKESDRGKVIAQEFSKAGIRIELEDDDMIIHPGKVKSCIMDSHGDHRIAMAATILGLAGAPIQIEGADAVSKSYPNFYTDLQKLGAKIE